ncbi:MAG: cytochrome o ubiquinol oxidase subunit III [Candidatus Saccharimonadales bacterium]|jgi:cytochrome o ubiquinol oxidase subunit 3
MSQVTTDLIHSKATFGFWLYLMTDCLVFATLFATFSVLRGATAGGPDGRELFDVPFVFVETMLLLTSSFTVGLGLLAARRGHRRALLTWFALTGLLGVAFLGMELYEFAHLVHEGHSWTRSAFLSSYFGLVGAHGLHIAVGLVWLASLLLFHLKHAVDERGMQRLVQFSLFWHFLDVIWVGIFTIVYLVGVL